MTSWLDDEDDEIETTASGIPIDVLDEVLARDSYRCQCCGNNDEEELHPHHVIFRSNVRHRYEPDLVHSPENIVTVCSRCHNLIHNGDIRVARIKGHWFFNRNRPWYTR